MVLVGAAEGVLLGVLELPPCTKQLDGRRAEVYHIRVLGLGEVFEHDVVLVLEWEKFREKVAKPYREKFLNENLAKLQALIGRLKR